MLAQDLRQLNISKTTIPAIRKDRFSTLWFGRIDGEGFFIGFYRSPALLLAYSASFFSLNQKTAPTAELPTTFFHQLKDRKDLDSPSIVSLNPGSRIYFFDNKIPQCSSKLTNKRKIS